MQDVVTPTFQTRGLTTSGLAIEGGSRAAVQQAIGVSNLVLQQAAQNAAFLGGVTSDILGRGAAAKGRAVGGGLTGLGLERQAQAGALDIQGAGLARASSREESALERAAAERAALAKGIGQIGGTVIGGMFGGPLGASFGGSLGGSLFGAGKSGSPLQQAGGGLDYSGFQRQGLFGTSSPIPSLIAG